MFETLSSFQAVAIGCSLPHNLKADRVRVITPGRAVRGSLRLRLCGVRSLRICKQKPLSCIFRR